MLAVFGIGTAAVLAIRANQKNKKRKAGEYNADVQATTEDLYVDTGFPAKDVFIAGLAHHCDRADVGMFTGFVYNDKGNAVNRKAMAVWDNRTQKIIGYVPEAVLEEYRDYCGGRRCVCIGYIYDDGEHLRGRFRAYLPEVNPNADMDAYAAQVCEHFGWHDFRKS